MIIRDDHKLEKLLKTLKFSQSNADLAMEYLTAEAENDALLERAEPQNFRKLNPGECASAWDHQDWVRRSDREKLGRYLKLFFAIGKSTAVNLWRPYHRGNIHKEQQMDWLLSVLPKAAVAAMEADRLAWDLRNSEEIGWLHQLALAEPEVLEEAQKLNGSPSDNMKVALAGILLSQASDQQLIRRQGDILLENNVDTLDAVAGWLDDKQLLVLRQYMRAGVWTPQLPGGLPNPSAADALQTRNSDDYLTGLLGLASFQAMGVDTRARCALQMYLRLNPQAVLNSITHLGSLSHFLNYFDDLLENLPGGAATMLLFLAHGRYWIDDDTKRKLMHRCVSGLAEAMKHANPNQYLGITQLLPAAAKFLGDEKQRIIAILQRYASAGQQELADFLLGSGSLKDSLKELSAVSVGWCYPSQESGMMVLYRLEHGWDDFLCRCAVVLGIPFEGRAMGNILANYTHEQATKIAAAVNVFFGASFAMENLEDMVEALIAHELPLTDVMTIVGKLHDDTYNEELQKKIRACVYMAAAKPEFIPDLCDAAKTGSVFARQTAINALYNLAPDHPEAKAGVLAAAGDSSKQIKEALVTLYAGRPEWAEDYKKLLSAKKAAERLLAVEVLARLNEREALEAALAAEKNAKVADAIRSKLGAEAPAAVGSAEDVAANLVKGNKIKKLNWLLEQPLPKLRKKDGSDADETIRNAILLSYCELGRVGRSDTAAELAAELDENDLRDLACEVYEHWFAAGAQAKHKWVLSFAAVFGGAAMTPRLQKAINDWPNHQRGAIACDAVMALALSTDPAAIVIVDAISRKFKFRQVKQAAALALENAAKELGITAEELADRIVPDLGFGRDGKRVFDYGKRSFTVRLTPTLELEITNDAGKAVKNLPAPGKTDDAQAAEAYEEFKTMKKQIKTTVTAQRARLESALSVLRCWDKTRWEELFVGNPIMHQFAMSLIWGVYEDGTLTDTFRYMEDGSFNTVDEEEYELPENAKIGLVHPVELDDETLEGWKQQLEDYEIVQSLDQLARPVYTLEQEKAGRKVLEDFGGKMLNGLSLSGKLLGLGWYRGSVVDGGMFYSFYREDATLGIGVELRFSGSAVGYDDGGDVTVYDAVFYRGTINRGSYVYDEVKEENQIPLGEVPVRYYSEIVHHLTKATASSTQTEEGWRSERKD